jgi:hypothetical protein
MHEVNAAMDAVAARFGTLHYDAAGDEECHDPRMWAVDRLHPSERGHRLIACRFHDMLAGAGLLIGPRPDPEPSSPPPTRLAEFGWLATKGTAWVLRRSIDLVPGLLALAIRERWSSEAPDTSVTGPGAPRDVIGAGAAPDVTGPGAPRELTGSGATLEVTVPGATLDVMDPNATTERVAARPRARQAR